MFTPPLCGAADLPRQRNLDAGVIEATSITRIGMIARKGPGGRPSGIRNSWVFEVELDASAGGG